MKEIPDKSINLILIDPPYGISINKKDIRFGTRPDLVRKPNSLEWDDFIPTKEYFEEMF